jgi:hypothetical protein
MKIVPASLFAMMITFSLNAQKKGVASINQHDLKMHMEFLASDELEGRDTGRPGSKIAARYLAVQAVQLGLIPADEDGDYLQSFIIEEKGYKWKDCSTMITAGDSAEWVNHEPFYVLPAPGGDNTIIEGEVVFAGYGINSENDNYNDFHDIEIEDKVVLIMNRAPMNEEGTETLFDNGKWNSMQNFQYKMQYIRGPEPY